jgi:hypothetical protein
LIDVEFGFEINSSYLFEMAGGGGMGSWCSSNLNCSIIRNPGAFEPMVVDFRRVAVGVLAI